MKRPDRSLNDVQMLLGHSSFAVTLEYVEANMETRDVTLKLRMPLRSNPRTNL